NPGMRRRRRRSDAGRSTKISFPQSQSDRPDLMRRLGLLGLFALACTPAPKYDLVIQGGRVMDPASGLDSVRNVGITGGKIAAISSAPLAGTTVVDAAGKVVAPGFIDLHAHGQTTADMEIQAQDGVTTALELEVGVYPVDSWYRTREGKSPLNYGAT